MKLFKSLGQSNQTLPRNRDCKRSIKLEKLYKTQTYSKAQEKTRIKNPARFLWGFYKSKMNFI